MKTHNRNKSVCRDDRHERSISKNNYTEHNRSIDTKYKRKKSSNQKKVKKNTATSPDYPDQKYLENIPKKV